MAETDTQNANTNESSGASRIYYPLTKMNFLVSIDKANGIAAFNEVTGIEATVDVIEFRQGNSGSLSPVKLPGLVKHGNITLKMGYVTGQDCKTWIQNCVSSQRGIMDRRNVTIELIDTVTNDAPKKLVDQLSGTSSEDGKGGATTWVLSNAWVCKYVGPDLNSTANEVAIESVEIAYEELTIPN